MVRALVSTILALVTATFVTAQTAPITAIRAGRLIDPDTGTSTPNAIVLIEGTRIRAVGAGVTIPANATVIDLSSLSVMPGVFDMHAHLCMTVNQQRDAGNYFYTTLRDPDSMRAVQGVANARAMLEAGFTSVRDIGNEGNYACVSVSRGIQQGLIAGPAMVTAGRIIAPYGGQFHLQPDKRALGEPEYFYADTQDEMRKAVRENIHFGAGVIKIVVDDQRYIYSVDDIRFIKAEAAAAGVKLAAHAWTPAGVHNAAEAAVDSIEHGQAAKDEDLALMKKNGVVLVGTDYLALGGDRAVWIDRLKRAQRIGVTMAYGTDVIDAVPGQTRGTESMRGIEPWIEAGIPAPVLLRAMTTNAAKLMGTEKQRGAIAVGLAADIIAMPGNPLEDATALKKVSFVMKDGKVVRK